MFRTTERESNVGTIKRKVLVHAIEGTLDRLRFQMRFSGYRATRERVASWCQAGAMHCTNCIDGQFTELEAALDHLNRNLGSFENTTCSLGEMVQRLATLHEMWILDPQRAAGQHSSGVLQDLLQLGARLLDTEHTSQEQLRSLAVQSLADLELKAQSLDADIQAS